METQVDVSKSEPSAPDFFISYTQSDVAWAKWIAWQLKENHWTVVLQAWDFDPTGDFVRDMQRAASTARRTIAVLSPAYLNSDFAMRESYAAIAQDPDGRLGKLVPVRIFGFKPTGLFASSTYIDLVNLDEVKARNKLLYEVGPARRKEWEEPDFPGQPSPAQQQKTETAPLEAGSGPEFPGGGPASIPGMAAASFQISVHFPSEFNGLEPQKIELKIRIQGAAPNLMVTIRHDAFLITSGDPAETNIFCFSFNGPGKWRRELEMRALQPREANYRVTVSCADGSGKVWLEKTWPVTVSVPRSWLARQVTRLRIWTKRRPARATLIALAGVVVMLCVRVGMATVDWRVDVLRHWPGLAPDYFASPDHKQWVDFFRDKEDTRGLWLTDKASWEAVPKAGSNAANGQLHIQPLGFAMPHDFEKSALRDFDAVILLRLTPQYQSTWLLGSSLPGRHGKGYRFTLSSTEPDSDGAGFLSLHGYACKDLASPPACAPLANDDGPQPFRSRDHTLQVVFRAIGSKFLICPSINDMDDPQRLGLHVFRDTAKFLPLSIQGAIAFEGGQILQKVQILPTGDRRADCDETQ